MNRIKELRTLNEIGQQDLAEKLNIGCATLSRYENCKAPVPSDILLDLSKIFACSTDYIIKRNYPIINQDNDIHLILLELVKLLKSKKDIYYKRYPLNYRIRELSLMLIFNIVRILECVVSWQ
jgi:transcriptional regulator with XRE-family HTH domain